MKNFIYAFVHIMLPIFVVVLALLLCRWMFNAVMATDWPDWVKYLILRG